MSEERAQLPLAGLLWLAAANGCSAPAALVQQGGTCYVVSDCAEGLACVPQPDGTRRCSNDLTPIQFAAEGGPADAMGTPDATRDAPASSDAPSAPGPDGMTPPPFEGGGPPDVGGVLEVSTAPEGWSMKETGTTETGGM